MSHARCGPCLGSWWLPRQPHGHADRRGCNAALGNAHIISITSRYDGHGPNDTIAHGRQGSDHTSKDGQVRTDTRSGQ